MTVFQGKRKLSPLKLGGIYIGTVVGAGFASGREILQFFGFYGWNGCWGILLSTGLFAFLGMIILHLGHIKEAQSHREVVRQCAGPLLGRGIDWIITFFLFGTFTTMAAGAGAVLFEQFAIPFPLGSALLVTLSVGTVFWGIERVLNALGAIAPVLIGSITILSFMALVKAPVVWWLQPPPPGGGGSVWPWSAIVYVSYNLVMAIAVLAPTGALAEKSALPLGALWGGIGLGMGALMIQLVLLSYPAQTSACEIPMLWVARMVWGKYAPIYSVVLLAEVYTTAAGCLYGFCARWADRDSLRFQRIIFGCGVAGWVGSSAGFSHLVSSLYPIVGYTGILMIGALLWSHFNMKIGYKKKIVIYVKK